MHRDGANLFSPARSAYGGDRDGNGPCGLGSVLLHRFGRFTAVLTAVAAAGLVCAPAKPGLAATRHAVRSDHSATLKPAGKPARSVKPWRSRRLSARTRPAVRVLRTAWVHQDAVPLANTAWDNPNIPPNVLSAINTAARESGIDPGLLTAIAWRESRFDPNARNLHSSAKGLLQFTTATWLQAVRDHGPQHDAAQYAAVIQKDRSGTLVVANDDLRTAILQLRTDPVLSAKLAAAVMTQQRAVMQDRLQRNVSPVDLYLTHVLGPSGAARFLTAVAQRPSASSLEVASWAVMRNAGLLAQDGRPLTVARTYAAAKAMLDAQHARSEPLFAAAKTATSAPQAAPMLLSVAP